MTDFIDPVTGKTHRKDHICNQQCRRLEAEATKKKRETVELQKVLESLKNPSKLISENREAVVVYKDELDVVLARLEELESQKTGVLDKKSDLKVGDTVISLVRYMELEPGTSGKVVSISPTEDRYPIEVKFEGITFAYLRNATVAFSREELGKLS